MIPIGLFILVFLFIAPAIAIAGTAAGHPWGELYLIVSGLLVALAAWNGRRSVLSGSSRPWYRRGGSQMRVIVGLTMVAALGILLAAGSAVLLVVNLLD